MPNIFEVEIFCGFRRSDIDHKNLIPQNIQYVAQYVQSIICGCGHSDAIALQVESTIKIVHIIYSVHVSSEVLKAS